jgi:predicted Fe-Mo cluster-binding NifX family protein
MNVAIPHCRGRVSPVFDVARNILVIETDGQVELGRRDAVISAEDPPTRAARLAETGADVLICGAISRPMEIAVVATGIDVILQTCGEVETVLDAFLQGRLHRDAYRMPGCCGRRRRRRRGGRTV